MAELHDQEDIDALLDDMDEQERVDRLLEERRSAQRRAEIAEWKRLLSAKQKRDDYLKVIADHAPLLSVPKLERIKAPKGVDPHTWVLVVSDVHVGQRTRFEATGGLYEQSTEITWLQMRTLWSKLVELHQYNAEVDTLVILDLGDIHEGDQMRASQAQGIDMVVTQQCIEATDMLAWLYNQALTRFRQVIVKKVGGNHDRTSTKAGNAGLGELAYVDTFAWLQGAFLERLFDKSIQAGRLQITNHDSWYGTARIAGWRFAYEHGASFRTGSGSYGGVSWYPITNAARGYQEMLDGADYICMGHFHSAAVLPMKGGWGWQVMNGSFPPSTEWVQSSFKKFSRPSQTLLKLHPRTGLVQWQPLYIDTEHQLKPGQFWESQDDKENDGSVRPVE